MAKAKHKKTALKDEAEKVAEVTFKVDTDKPKEKSSVEYSAKKEHKPMVAFSLNKASEVRHAVPAGNVVHTAIALKTCTRFVGGWIVLEAGKEVRARKEVIESLRVQGLVG